jgi:hypothetical protein
VLLILLIAHPDGGPPPWSAQQVDDTRSYTKTIDCSASHNVSAGINGAFYLSGLGFDSSDNQRIGALVDASQSGLVVGEIKSD